MTVADRQPLVSHETVIHRFERIEGVDRESVCRDEMLSIEIIGVSSKRVFRPLKISLFQEQQSCVRNYALPLLW